MKDKVCEVNGCDHIADHGTFRFIAPNPERTEEDWVERRSGFIGDEKVVFICERHANEVRDILNSPPFGETPGEHTLIKVDKYKAITRLIEGV